jgi:threonine synthase
VVLKRILDMIGRCPSIPPEGATTLTGYRRLVEDGTIDQGERVLLYNTGTGLKYLDLFA